MIITVTMNPSIDYFYTKDKFEIGITNKFPNPFISIGGKGINSTRTIKSLGGESIAATVFAGTSGLVAKNRLELEKIDMVYMEIEGTTRNAVTIVDGKGIQTEITEEGPLIKESEQKQFLNILHNLLLANPSIKVVCLSGSANSKDPYIYVEMIKLIRSVNSEIFVIADLSKHHLINVLHASIKPNLIKPNITEFSELIGKEVHQKEEVINELKNVDFGIECIVVSCGEKGAVVKYKSDIYDVQIPKIKVVNPTGSGDATVGGMAYGIDKGLDFKDWIKLGMACGISNALEEEVGRVNVDIMEELLQQIYIK